MRTLCLLALALAWPYGTASAAIFKCVDSQGRITYTNDSGNAKGCAQLDDDLPVSSVPAMRPPPKASPQNFPKVSPEVQRSRDDGRRAILDSELDTEQKALDKARADLAEQDAVRLGNERNYQRKLDRLQPFKDQIELHERNIEALKKEISNLR